MLNGLFDSDDFFGADLQKEPRHVFLRVPQGPRAVFGTLGIKKGVIWYITGTKGPLWEYQKANNIYGRVFKKENLKYGGILTRYLDC